MDTKVLVIAVVENDNKILMRKKPDGSLPYKETWYVFGVAVDPSMPIEEVITKEIKVKSGANTRVQSRVSWDTEIKLDLDGIQKFFVYLDVICEYIDGELMAGEGVERLEWVAKRDLDKYDIVPPSRILFKKLGYI